MKSVNAVCVCVMCVCVSGNIYDTQSRSFSFLEAIKSSTQFAAPSSRLVCHSASLVRGISSLLLLFTAFIFHPWILIHLAIDTATAKASSYTSACCVYMWITGCVGGWGLLIFFFFKCVSLYLFFPIGHRMCRYCRCVSLHPSGYFVFMCQRLVCGRPVWST